MRRARHGIARRLGLGVCVSLLLSGCSLVQSTPPIEEPLSRVAVLPFTRGGPLEGDKPMVPAAAGTVLTAQVYDVLASSPQWRFVPDLTAAQALTTLAASDSREERARAFGRAVNADAVLTGTVTRYVQRQGSAYGATRPASVAFDLELVSVKSGEVLWRGTFDQTQEPLAWNLLNWWQFWAAGPRWMTVDELAHLGVERLMNELAGSIHWE